MEKSQQYRSKLRLSLDSNDSEQQQQEAQKLKKLSSDSSDSREKQQIVEHNQQFNRSIRKSRKPRSIKTPVDEEQQIPQVRSMIKHGTYISQASPTRQQQHQPRPSGLQSLSHSQRFSRIVPEGEQNNNFKSNPGSNDSGLDDSFFQSQIEQEANDYGRYRYDMRYHHIKFIVFPDDPTKIAWDLIILVALMYVSMVIPYNIAFVATNEQTETESIISTLIEVLYGIDILINMITAYVDNQDELIVDRVQIFKNYVFGWFILDFIAIFPFDYILQDFDNGSLSKVAKLPRLYKLSKLIKMSRILKLCLQRQKYNEYLYGLSNLSQNIRIMLLTLFSVILVCHLFSCLWYFIGRVSSDSENWVTQFVKDEEDVEIYILAFYWVVQTMATTGYGDITATNSTEQLIAILIMIIGVVFFSVTIGSVSSLFTQLDSKNLRLKERMEILNEVAKKHKLENVLYSKISKVLKFGYKNNQNEYVGFLTQLPLNLRIELSLCMYRNTVQGIDLFKEKPVRFTAYIGPLLNLQMFQEDDIIYNEGDYANEIYFIKQGTISFCIKQLDYHPFQQIVRGQYFGEIDLLFGEQRKYTAVATTPCEVLTLSKTNFLKIFFTEFKDIGQELHLNALKNKFTIQQNYKRTFDMLKGLEQKAEEGYMESPPKKVKLNSLEKWSKNIALQAKTNSGLVSEAIEEVKQNPHPELHMRMTRLKTVLITKGLLQSSHTNEENIEIKQEQFKEEETPQKPIERHQRNAKKSLTMMMKQEETTDQKHMGNSQKNIQFFKRKGKLMYL